MVNLSVPQHYPHDRTILDLHGIPLLPRSPSGKSPSTPFPIPQCHTTHPFQHGILSPFQSPHIIHRHCPFLTPVHQNALNTCRRRRLDPLTSV